MPKYTPHYKPNQLICGFGSVAIISGWTVKEAIAKKLERYEYAVIGQLYNPTRGISFLIRNLLANPHVTTLVILGCTREDKNSGSCECLIDFLRDGFRLGISDTGRECWIINSKITGYIDIEISAEALEKLRQSVVWVDVKSISELVERVRAAYLREPYGEPMLFPVAEVIPWVLPGTRYGHRIEGKTIADTWVKIIHRIKTTGTIRPTGYDGQWQELIDLVAVVTDEPAGFYFPDPNYLPCDRAFITEYLPHILSDAPNQEGIKYTYGQRLRSWFGVDQIEQVISKLIGEIDAASAVMSLWDVRDHTKGGSPCLNHLWVRVVDNELSLTATFRSNDMFSAWVSNAMGLRALQVHIRDEIAKRSSYNLTLGALITISQSAHIYDDCWENADMLIRSHYSKGRRDYHDACGNFIIEVCDNEIIVTQTSHIGEAVRTYKGEIPLTIIREIAASSPAIAPEHIGYLGIELERARVLGTAYRQDVT